MNDLRAQRSQSQAVPCLGAGCAALRGQTRQGIRRHYGLHSRTSQDEGVEAAAYSSPTALVYGTHRSDKPCAKWFGRSRPANKAGNEALTEPRTRTPLTVKELGPTANRETLQCQMTAEGIIRIRKRVRLVNKALREIHTVYYHTLAMGLRMQGQSLQNIK